MLHPDYPFWSFVGLLAVLLPIPWHWRARNIATLSLIFWSGLTNLIIFLNTQIWADNYRDVSPVWCDISKSLFRFEAPRCGTTLMDSFRWSTAPHPPLRYTGVFPRSNAQT